MSEAALSMTYEAFSAEPEYIEANRAFTEALDLEGTERLLDLACGTGLLGDLVLDRQPGITVIGLDLSEEQLALAQERFREKGLFVENGRDGRAAGQPGFLFVEGTADALPFASAAMDTVLMGHSIHNLPDADRLLAEVYRVLRPGGLFAFNSAFYAGTYVPGTEKFHQAWIREALGFVMNRDRELREQGLPGVKRKRGTVKPAFSKRWRSPGEWGEILERNGLEPTHCGERRLEMSRRNFETVGSYAGLASVLLSGYPVELACEALQASVAPALAEVGLEKVPQQWLEMTAVRPGPRRG
jgi:ubiquinone/menaquinone biosynthesis C-methylase UbiE